MKTTNETWKQKLQNLHSRTKGISSEHQIDYKSLIKKIHIGKTVLDVGCGTQWLKNYLPAGTKYYGLDAYITGDNVFNARIEDVCGRFKAETLFIFAALDGMQDLYKAFTSIKSNAQHNVVILTGINIEPDLYHTHLITENFIDTQMQGWRKTVRVQVHPKIIFLEYVKL